MVNHSAPAAGSLPAVFVAHIQLHVFVAHLQLQRGQSLTPFVWCAQSGVLQLFGVDPAALQDSDEPRKPLSTLDLEGDKVGMASCSSCSHLGSSEILAAS